MGGTKASPALPLEPAAPTCKVWPRNDGTNRFQTLPPATSLHPVSPIPSWDPVGRRDYRGPPWLTLWSIPDHQLAATDSRVREASIARGEDHCALRPAPGRSCCGFGPYMTMSSVCSRRASHRRSAKRLSSQDEVASAKYLGLNHSATLTNPLSTGTSTRGPITPAKAAQL